MKAAMLGAALLLAPAATASPLCDLTNRVIEAGSTSPIFGPIATRVPVPEGWLRCTIARHNKSTGSYLCYGPAGHPQATSLAHLVSVNAEIAACTGLTGVASDDEPGHEGQRNYRMVRGPILITVATYLEDGDVRLRIEFAHPA